MVTDKELQEVRERIAEKKKKQLEDVKKQLRTPFDVTGKTPHEKASLLCLSFIGYVARPKGLTEQEIRVAVDAFNNNRGKIEWEIEAVEKALIELEAQK